MPPAGPIICESSGVISGNQEVGSEALKEEEEKWAGGVGKSGGRSQEGVMDGTGKHFCSVGCENKTRMCVVPGQPRGYR